MFNGKKIGDAMFSRLCCHIRDLPVVKRIAESIAGCCIMFSLPVFIDIVLCMRPVGVDSVYNGTFFLGKLGLKQKISLNWEETKNCVLYLAIFVGN